VDVVLDELVRALQKLRGDDHHRSGTVTNFLVLEVREFAKNFAGGVLDFELECMAESKAKRKGGRRSERRWVGC
jgi:hypothetical protein